jgi:hypothetical protein
VDGQGQHGRADHGDHGDQQADHRMAAMAMTLLAAAFALAGGEGAALIRRPGHGLDPFRIGAAAVSEKLHGLCSAGSSPIARTSGLGAEEN